MKEQLLADLDARIARHAGGDSTGVLDQQALVLIGRLTELGAPDAGSLARVAAVHLCRYQALPPEHADTDLRLARAIYAKLHKVDPRLVSPRVRGFFGFASPRDSAIARLREHDRTGRLDHLDRAISLFRQEVLEESTGHADLAAALRRRHALTGQQADLDEAGSVGDR